MNKRIPKPRILHFMPVLPRDDMEYTPEGVYVMSSGSLDKPEKTNDK